MELYDTTYDWKKMSLLEYLERGHVPSKWKDVFEQQHQKLSDISSELDKCRKTSEIYPPIHQVFRSFYLTPLYDIKAVIIGMDPYHNGSAVGLCFSVKPGNQINPSLRSIYKELKLEGFTPTEDGNLIHWANQGILMLNMGLTVMKNSPGSHLKFWYSFSEEIVKYIDEKRGEEVDWLLLGNDAYQVKKLITKGKVHTTTHPMPLAAYRNSKNADAFWGSNVFKNIKGVQW